MGGQVFGNHKVKYPNLQYHFAPAFNKYEGRNIILSQGFLLQCDQLRPKSKGSITLKSDNPKESPNSFFNYLSHPHDITELREAFKKYHALQCGYCTPGFLTTIVYLLEKKQYLSEEEIRKKLSGNICRCTGYQNIVAAVKEAATKM